MNRPRFNRLCKFHCDQRGNLCHFGDACWYGHAQELHRPTTGEQTANLLLTIYNLIAFAVSCLQQPKATQSTAFSGFEAQRADERVDDADDDLKHDQAEPPQPKMAPATPKEADVRQNVNVPDDGKPDIDCAMVNDFMEDKTNVKYEPEVSAETFETFQPIGGKPFEDHIEVKVDTADEHNDFRKAKIPKIAANKTLGIRKTEKLWRFVLANAPLKLVTKYPKLLHEFQKQHYLGDMDAVLTGLKKAELNGKPVIIKGRNHSKQRFMVEIHEHSKTPRSLLIKNENLQTLRPRPGSDAFQLFKDDIETDSWAILTVNDCCYHNENLLRFFINHQFVYYDARTATKDGYTLLCTDAVKYAKERGYGVTKKDCPKILSLLYSLCFQRKLHIVRVFEIPLS